MFMNGWCVYEKTRLSVKRLVDSCMHGRDWYIAREFSLD